MLSFKRFLKEQETIEISNSPDKNLLEENLELINNDLDAVTDKPFVNNLVFINAVRGTLERYGIVLPHGYEMLVTVLESEITYSMDNDSGYYVYIVYNLNSDGYVEGYAQIVNEEDLDDLLSIGDGEITDKGDVPTMDELQPSNYLLRARRSDDDSE